MRPAIVILIAVLSSCPAAPPALHPLAPLTAAEIRDAARIIRPRVPASARFSIIALDEPPKEIVLRQIAAPRRAFAILYDTDANRTWEAIADLDDAPRRPPAGDPRTRSRWSPARFCRADQIVRADPRWRAPWRRAASATSTTWSSSPGPAGYFDLPGTEQGQRRARHSLLLRRQHAQYYAHPIEGVVAHVNLTTGKVLEFLDTDRNVPVPRETAELGPLFNAPLRVSPGAARDHADRRAPDSASRTAKCAGRSGASATRCIRAKAWCCTRSGYEDGGRVRPVMYRGSLSEMVVPYGDPSGGWFFRNSFDAGELGLGINAHVA